MIKTYRKFSRHSLFFLAIHLILNFGLTFSSIQADPHSLSDAERMAAVTKFAETILKHGRDTYGKKHSPLFIDYLDVSTLKAPEKMYITRLGGPGPRSKQPYQPVVMSNLAHQGNLSRFLVGLSHLTGDPKYKEAYKDSLRYYFKHYATPNGLLHMGHHRWVNVKTDHYDGDDQPPGHSGHEMKRDYPHYAIYWEADPDATRRMLSAHWSSHIQDWGFMNFTRHGSYVKELNEEKVWSQPKTPRVIGIVPGNLTFFDSGSDIIWAGAQLGYLNKDERPLYWAQRLYARYADSAHPDTGLPPWHHTSMRDFGSKDYPVPEYAMIPRGGSGLLGAGGVAMLRIGEDLGENGRYYRETMRNQLIAFAKHMYDLEKNLFKDVLIDGTDLAEREKKKNPNIGVTEKNPWQPWSPDPTTICAYAICFKQSKDPEIWKTLRAMCRGNDLGDIGEVGGKSPNLNLSTSQTNTLLIFTLVEIFKITNDPSYLDLSRTIANNAIRKYFRKEQGLFSESALHRTSNLCSALPLAILTLEAALRGKLDQVPTYAASNEAEYKPHLRPLKWRPYKPTVSHLYYPGSANALCDDLHPESTEDGRIPFMAWAQVRKPTDDAVVTFPDILKGPATISGLADHPESRNSVSVMNIDSPHSYTFDGTLKGTGDLTINVAQGDHFWTENSTWHTVDWSPYETYDLIFNIAKDAKFTFQGRLQEIDHARRWGKGAGVIKNGEGTLELTADHNLLYRADPHQNRAYRSPTEINAGVLLVNNKKGSGVSPKSMVKVYHGGTLSGNGTIGKGGSSAVVVVDAGGKIHPGDGIGTLTLKDGLILRDGARLEFEIGKNQHDQLRITGGTLQGCEEGVVVTIKNRGGLARGKSFKIIDWTGASSFNLDKRDFKLDKSQDWQGTFHIVGTTLRFSTFAPRIFPETPPAIPPAPKRKRPKKLPSELKPPIYKFTWNNPKGGSWMESQNWQDAKIPNTKDFEWVQYNFKKTKNPSKVQVYWYTGHGSQVPESWRILYQQGGKWKPVEAQGAYTVETNKFNEVQFKPIKTKRLKLEAMLQPGVSAGILEWRVE